MRVWNSLKKVNAKIKDPFASESSNNNHTSIRDERQNTAANGLQRITSISSIHFINKKTLGWKIRDVLGWIERTFGPYFKKVLPNFIAVHYFFVISMAILGSILMYPVKDFKYIDILLLATGAATQAGLNSVNINDLSLYQQIIIYILCCLTTPIFIHGSLCFLRLYWFERHFDNIRESSKVNFQMRRSHTLMTRTKSMDQHRTMDSSATSKHHGIFHRRNASDMGHNTNAVNNEEQYPFTFPKASDHLSPDSKESDTSSSSIPRNVLQIPAGQNQNLPVDHLNMVHYGHNDSVEHISEPSSSDDDRINVSPDDRAVKRFDGTNQGTDFTVNDSKSRQPLDSQNYSNNSPDHNIRFADLPKPSRTIEPRDMYMSISMMRDNKRQELSNEENQGPALVIKGPAERERSKSAKNNNNSRPISHRHNSAIQFDLAEKPKKQKRRKAYVSHSRKPSFSSIRFRRGGENDDDVEEESNTDSEADDDVGMQYIKKTQSNLQLPSSDQTGGKKFSKRSNTLDAASNKESMLHKSPTFERIIKQKLRRPRKIRRRLSSFAVDDDNESHSTNSRNVDTDNNTDSDDESDINSLQRNTSTNYLSWIPKIGRNSTFVDLTEDQKEELGGVEYRALKLLSKILVLYYVGFHILGFIFLVPWILGTKSYQEHVRESGVSLSWWGFFTSMSAFNDLGFTLTPDSMNSFNTSIYVLLIVAVLVIIGNTGFPILLRFIIWVLFKFSRELSLFRESLGFLLDHPRRCFTLLFPSAPTWWLFFILLVLNAVDLILFIILDLGAKVVKSLAVHIRVLDGFFQAVSTRTAGFGCVDLSQLHPGVQVSYMVMMYISVMPLAISIRRTNVYEEQSLGVYVGNDNDVSDNHEKASSFIGAHLRKQLSFDLWFVFLGLFIICIAEGGKIQDESLPEFNVFQVLFEVVSAYGTVGLSLGYPNSYTSFTGQFNVISKLVIIAMMIRGRHRGLPYSIDRAIILPSDKMDERDRFQAKHAGQHIDRSETIGAQDDPVITFFQGAMPKFLKDKMRRPSFLDSRSFTNHRNSYITIPRNTTIATDTIQHNGEQPYKDLHFAHPSYSDTNIGTREDQDIEMENLNEEATNRDKPSHEEDEGSPTNVYRSETYGGIHSIEDAASRQNSIYTL